MRYGVLSGALWGLDTVILAVAMLMAPYVGGSQAQAAVVASFLHDAACAVWLFVYMCAKCRIGETRRALRTRSGLVVALGALLGGPVGMTGYVVAINNLGAGYTAVLTSVYPAFGTLLSFLLLKERMSRKQLLALAAAILGIMVMGWFSSTSVSVGNVALGLAGALLTVVGWGSEAVLCAWGMRDDVVDNEVALQIRETASALAFAVLALPLAGTWKLATSALIERSLAVLALSALIGTVSYLCYYRAIDAIGASHAMGLNVSYSAWAIFFGFLIQGTKPSIATVACCIVILISTVLSAARTA